MEGSKPTIFEGVQEDCESLLVKYEKLKSVRFTEFTKIWKEMKFSGIYGNKQLYEIDIFVPEVLFMVKQYFVKAASFNLKVGALYLLYSLYYKQPFKTHKKILITYSDWLSIKEFIKEIKENNHFDTLLIICKLISDNAFLWSATTHIKGEIIPHQYFHYGLFYTNSLIDDIALENDLHDLKEIEAQYLEARNIACEQTSNTAYKESINYCSSISEELLSILNDTDAYSTNNELESNNLQDSTHTIGKRRKLLKSKCFKEKVSPTKSSTDQCEEN